MQRFRREFELPAAADTVFELMKDPDFQRRKALSDPKCIGVEVTSDARGGEVVIELRREAKPMWGDDPNTSTLTMTWPASVAAGQTRRGQWVHRQHGQEKRSASEGTVELQPLGSERCKLVMEGFVEIRVPLLGRRIEKKVAKVMESQGVSERAFYLAELEKRGLL